MSKNLKIAIFAAVSLLVATLIGNKSQKAIDFEKKMLIEKVQSDPMINEFGGVNGTTVPENDEDAILDDAAYGSISFDVQGRRFTVYTYGGFSFSSRSGDDIEYNYSDLVKQVGPVRIEYNYSDQVKRIGNVRIEYNYSDQLKRVGCLRIEYNYSGQMKSTSGNVHC